MNRLAFGPRPGDVQALAAKGLNKWLDEQLAPDNSADEPCNSRLKSAQLRIHYDAGHDRDVSWGKVDELRPLSTLDKPLSEVWHLSIWGRPMAYDERVRPFMEVLAATWIRAVYSKWQLREVLVDFWHNHFNVNAEVDIAVQVAFPSYDRDVIRANCLGNFRKMIEAVATSVPMLRYLNNSSSRASPANENYGRELFELHTLGAENYLNSLYNRWRDVPGAMEGKPTGYIDQDVYEAARAFTGWTFAGGQDVRDQERLPDTGQFTYVDSWHDNYQKRVLGVDFDPNQPPMDDGRKVLDLIVDHPGTARHICRKLCVRILADEPPQLVVDHAVEVWTKNRNSPDQIAQTVRAIVLSDEFAKTWGQKVKRPLEFVAALLRASDVDFTPDERFFWTIDQTNQRLFRWPTPVGHPDQKDFWLGATAMISRFSFPNGMLGGWWGDSIKPHLAQQMPAEISTCRKMTEFWVMRMLGYMPDESTMGPLLIYACQGTTIDAMLPASDQEIVERVNRLAALIGMSPQFNMR
jgi:uncharacterized protein (DUF1800 family)